MEYLVAYDVATDSPEARRRLRKVAQVCEAHGQRVQKSVFECTLNAAQMELLLHKLWRIIEQKNDSIRIYRLREPRGRYTQLVGTQPHFDIHDALIV